MDIGQNTPTIRTWNKVVVSRPNHAALALLRGCNHLESARCMQSQKGMQSALMHAVRENQKTTNASNTHQPINRSTVRKTTTTNQSQSIRFALVCVVRCQLYQDVLTCVVGGWSRLRLHLRSFWKVVLN